MVLDSKPFTVADVEVPVEIQVALQTPLRFASMQYSYETAPVDAAHDNTSPLRAAFEAPLLGLTLLKAAGIAPLMVMVNKRVVVRARLSVARNSTLKTPAVLGVPLIRPVDAVSERLAGSAPDAMDQV